MNQMGAQGPVRYSLAFSEISATSQPSRRRATLVRPLSRRFARLPSVPASPTEEPSHPTVREASARDIPEILRQRRRMYEDMHYNDPHTLDTMASLSSAYLTAAMADGSFRAWLAADQDRVVAGGAVVISPWPAHPYDLQCRRATILNVYTDPEYRRRGIARKLMQTMIAWCKREGFARVTLHASDDGRALYESLGFEASNEMRLKLR
jgi:GNAT superfamily N-acetyltransferase